MAVVVGFLCDVINRHGAVKHSEASGESVTCERGNTVGLT